MFLTVKRAGDSHKVYILKIVLSEHLMALLGQKLEKI